MSLSITKAFQQANGGSRPSSSGHQSSSSGGSGLGSAEEIASPPRRSEAAPLGQFDVIMPSPGEMATVERKRTGILCGVNGEPVRSDMLISYRIHNICLYIVYIVLGKVLLEVDSHVNCDRGFKYL